MMIVKKRNEAMSLCVGKGKYEVIMMIVMLPLWRGVYVFVCGQREIFDVNDDGDGSLAKTLNPFGRNSQSSLTLTSSFNRKMKAFHGIPKKLSGYEL